MTETYISKGKPSFINNPAIRANQAFLALVVLYLAVCWLLSLRYGFVLDLSIYSDLTLFMLPIVGVLWLLGGVFVSFVRHRPERPISFIVRQMGTWNIGAGLARGLPVFLTTSIFYSAFSSLKSAMPLIVPYYFDPWAATFDRVIHGGNVWELLQPLIGYPFVTVALNEIYFLWFFVSKGVLILVSFMAGYDRLRGRFLVSTILCWALLGGLLAIGLSSVGPCYYSLFYGNDQFAGLMAYLSDVNRNYPLQALRAQRDLYESYLSAEPGFASGISALPSLHVAIAALMAIFAWHFSRILGVLATAFLILIFLGSIHLGWHYAIDGYISLVLVPGIWWLSAKMVRQHDAD